MSSNQKDVSNYYQGIFLTETILGNPNGSFIENEPRNIKGRVFTTDKCIKYNVRKYIKKQYEKTDEVKNFVFFYPRKEEGAEQGEASYLTKDSVFEKYLDSEFDELLNNCPDTRMFGGTFSFSSDDKAIYGPIQLSYGLDLIGAEIFNPQLGTPFSTSDGKQTTKGQDYLVDHAVIGYDVIVNPNNEPGLLKKDDLNMFKEAIVGGTNLRKSTSKKTNAKILLLVKFEDEYYPNLGDLKTSIKIESDKVSQEEKEKEDLTLNFGKVDDQLKRYEDKIENIELYTSFDVTTKNLDLDHEDKDFSDLVK